MGNLTCRWFRLRRPLPKTIVILLATALAAISFGLARTRTLSAQEEIEHGSIRLFADHCQYWTDSVQRVMIMRGRCSVRQDGTTLTGDRMVVWQKGGNVGPGTIEVYIEGEASLLRPHRSDNDSTMFLTLQTNESIATVFRDSFERTGAADPLYQRARGRRFAGSNNGLQQAEMVIPSEMIAQTWPAPTVPGTGAMRKLRLFPRSGQDFRILSSLSKSEPPEQVTTITGGVNIIVDGVRFDTGQGAPVNIGTIDLSADRVVMWTPPARGGDPATGQWTEQSADEMLQFYMEGNIVIRQGKNILEAKSAFIDIREDKFLLIDAELKAYVPTIDGHIRIRARELRQLARNRYHARDAWTSTSPFGKPGYRIQSSDVYYEQRQGSWFGQPTGGATNPYTGALQNDTVPWITTLNSQFIVGDTPLFSVPRLSFPADDPGIPLRRASVQQDSVFGFQVRTVWDMAKLVGMDSPQGLEWNLVADYLTDRGPALGTNGRYSSPIDPRLPGGYSGIFDVYGIHDDGEDNLGEDRRSLAPPNSTRGRAIFRHRQTLDPNTTLFGEIGYLSDRNFQEQYFEGEFDQAKDVETLVNLKHDRNNWGLSILARPQLNDFDTTTEWLPKAELIGLSEPLLGGLMTWSNRSSIGYARLRPGDAPANAADVYTPSPYVSNVEGLVAMTRQQLDMPFNLGPLKLTPFVMGEAAHWSEDFNGNDIDRLVGVAGIRASLMASKIYPYAYSRIFNVNGLHHKIQMNAEYTYTDSTRDLSEIPQYFEIDDNSQERFRSRFLTNTFGGLLPNYLDPRSFALRSGTGWSVAAPYHEIIDDQQVVRFNVRQRLQTRVGPPDKMRTKDWMTLDVGASIFPNADRDNFGETVGLINGAYRWNVGDRTSIVANGLFDVFDDGPNLWSVGLLTQRSTRGSAYLGYRQVKGGGLDSQLLTGSFTYQMSPKWVSTFGTAYDIAEGRNRGQSLTLTRIGLDWITHIGTSYDQSRDNVGFAFMFEPRFGSTRGSGQPLSSLLDLRATR